MTELTEEQTRVAMKSKEHLQEWLEKTGREYLIFRSRDLVDALSWPDGVGAFQEVLFAYREYRRQQPTGKTRTAEVAGEQVPILEMKDECLTVDERDELIIRLIDDISKIDRAWGSRILRDLLQTYGVDES